MFSKKMFFPFLPHFPVKMTNEIGIVIVCHELAMKIRKLEIEIISIYIAQFIDTMHCLVSLLCYTRSTKTICVKISAYSFA